MHRRDGVQAAGVPDEVALVLLVAAAALLATPFALGLMREVRRLGQTLAVVVLPAAEPGRLDLAAAPRRAFIVTLQVVMALLIGLPLRW